MQFFGDHEFVFYVCGSAVYVPLYHCLDFTEKRYHVTFVFDLVHLL